METILYILILLYSIILHEIAHGYAAYKNGDQTAFRSGRLTLNPMSHIDFIGSILVPLFTYFSFGFPFGWAKPVPYNPHIVSQKKFGELMVSAAGVLTNFLLTFLAVLFFYLLSYLDLINPDLLQALYLVATINILLGTFNLLPFPPADGWHIFVESYKHLKNFFRFCSRKITGKNFYETQYFNNSNNIFPNKFNSLFYNPLFMIFSIYLAIQVFHILTKYILQFINFLFQLPTL